MDIVTYKTAYYSFYLPVACGLHLADMASDDALATAERILVKMGQYFQIQVRLHLPHALWLSYAHGVRHTSAADFYTLNRRCVTI